MTATASKFWDQVALKYSQQPIADSASYTRKLKTTQEYMHQDMRVLEIGCGTGSTALEHAANVAHIDATDVSAAMIQIGQEKAARAKVENVHFTRASVEEIRAENGSYDMVLALNLMHLLPNRIAALQKVHQLLKPGGTFISSTVCLADRMWFLKPIIPVMQWMGKAPYVSFARAEEVLREMADEGFQEEEHWTHGRANSLFVVAKKL